ncbi:hypothetical protein AB6H26_11140 [Providencia hangzhouensis]|uniref:Uncharacterized protein n=1 Tax=Providencia rettgeri TaxID=587 RepID=A0A9N8CWV2_PRORE|nr:hypothetical protein [Providencia rettgeri]MBN7841186.1 hypothetical protein [Providencia rettgeri]MBN7855442.1 hypothetical protein [Providencia rettgeri]MBN7863485.1 hypothetical protein [Providencia rettgeri]MBN7872697.1 hypothetical protein [Providencia rettgeri]MBN7895233.1 hypothetical protein [Providencia rettgeri]
MNNKLQEEIEKVQDRAAGELVSSWYLARLANTILIACYSLDKGNIRLAKEWLFGAMEMWPDVDIYEDLKDSNGNAEDLQAWFDKGMEGELNHSQALNIIRKEYPELQRVHQINSESAKLIEAFCADDAEWHKLLDTREQENSTLIRLVVKLADKCTEMQKELERINNLLPSLPESIKCPTAPELIWLQVDPEPEQENKPVYPVNLYSGDVTWSANREFPTDTLYVRADFLFQSVKQC